MTSWLVAPQCTKPAASASRLGDLGGQRVDQRNREIAGDRRRLRQGLDVVALGLAGVGDRADGVVGDDADGGFRARQRDLEIEHALQPRAVGHDRAHRRAGKQRRQQGEGISRSVIGSVEH